MKIKTMRNIPTRMALVQRGKKNSREQSVNRLAHLEHEKARLERELDVWISNQQRTAARLRLVEEELTLVQQALGHVAPGAAPQPAARRPSRDDDDSELWRSISLEY